jgi:ribose transport system substrate-binding protein
MLLVFALMVATAGCGDDDDDSGAASNDSTSTEKTEKPANVAFLATIVDDYIQAKIKGLESAVEPGGGSVKVFNANFDPQAQLKQCQDAIATQRYNAIVLNAIDGPAGVPCVAAAKEAGIPVVTVDVAVGNDPNDIEPQVDGVVATVTQTPDGISKKVVELTKAGCEGIDPCEIIAEVATPTDETSNAAVNAVAKDVPNAKVVQKVSGEYDPSVIAKVFPDALSAHPEADVFLSAADSQALAVVPALKDAGRFGEIRLLGQAGSRDGAKAIEDGTLFGTVGLWPETEGRMAGEFAIAAVNGKPIDTPGNDTLEISQPSIVTKENVSEFTPEWGAGS